MTDFFHAHESLFGLMLLNCGFAMSQYIVLRAGVFSIATAGIAALGAYTAALLNMRYGFPAWVSVPVAGLVGLVTGLLLSIPLALLRGPYQAIATLAFVQIVAFTILFFENFTGGALGLNNIPRLVTIWQILGVVLIAIYVMMAISATRIGRAFDAIRQDEVVAASLSISTGFYHTLAFAISGVLAGLFGGMQAFYTYSLEPGQYGFPFVTAALAFVVFGGQSSVLGGVVGAVFLTAVPELARPLADNRLLVYGLLLMVVITFIPNGVVGSLNAVLAKRRAQRSLSLPIAAKPEEV
jgi:branched-chain amino acid transport system permease protein